MSACTTPPATRRANPTVTIVPIAAGHILSSLSSALREFRPPRLKTWQRMWGVCGVIRCALMP
jgi:hypothetical protein